MSKPGLSRAEGPVIARPTKSGEAISQCKDGEIAALPLVARNDNAIEFNAFALASRWSSWLIMGSPALGLDIASLEPTEDGRAVIVFLTKNILSQDSSRCLASAGYV